MRVRTIGLAIETAMALTLARAAMWLPFRIVVPDRNRSILSPVTVHRHPQDQQARQVGRMVERVGGLLPWHSSCLVEALAARMMLRRRGISSVLHFGVGRSDSSLKAHAWLEAEGGFVCGGREAVDFTPIAGFGEPT